MSFTQRCGKCGEVIQHHFVVRTKSGEKVICPLEHKRMWMRKWRWKYNTAEEAERGYMRTAFRAAKVGQPGARRPGSAVPRSRQMNRCDYCGLERADHEGRALYCPTDKNMREEPDERTRFGKRPSMDRYAVLSKGGYIIGFVKARWVDAAAKKAKKLYGTSSVMVVNTRKAKIGEHLHNTKPRKKFKNRAPWHRGGKKRKLSSGPQPKTCGYCGGRTGVMPLYDKKYGAVCNSCLVKIKKARERAKTDKFGSDRDPKKRKKSRLTPKKLAQIQDAWRKLKALQKRRTKKTSLIVRTKHPDMNGLHIQYSRVNDAYFVMWHDAVLKVARNRGEAEDFVRELVAKARVSNDPRFVKGRRK